MSSECLPIPCGFLTSEIITRLVRLLEHMIASPPLPVDTLGNTAFSEWTMPCINSSPLGSPTPVYHHLSNHRILRGRTKLVCPGLIGFLERVKNASKPRQIPVSVSLILHLHLLYYTNIARVYYTYTCSRSYQLQLPPSLRGTGPFLDAHAISSPS
ncbi:hypothetical protein BDZ97DRAFT_550805 [Flammula alnicola]|nr:hypothetical protein BDZ97DRAFT_550805 [Flammula alnicola]